MSYLAWYRKFRPQKFAEVIGQEDTITILKNEIINNNFAHAFLFSGPKGIGKTSVAKILARSINCENNVRGEVCTICQSCQQMFSGKENIDIIEIDGASNNGVDEIRNIRKNISILPMNLKYKIFIIDEVHMLTIAAFNALLMTLEEPPKHVIFIFATTEPNKLPETITSRCQWFAFEKIEQNKLITVFERILQAEQKTFEKAALTEIALLANGSLRDGINYLEKVANFSDEITSEKVAKIFNAISSQEKIQFLIDIFNHDTNAQVKKVREFNIYVNDIKKIINDLFYLVLDIIVTRLADNKKLSQLISESQLAVFDPVKIDDLKLVLHELEQILNINIPGSAVSGIVLSRIIKVNETIEIYNLKKVFETSIIASSSKTVSHKSLTNRVVKTNERQTNDSTIQQAKTLNDENQKKHTNEADKDSLQEKEIKTTDAKKEESIKINLELKEQIINVIVSADIESRKKTHLCWNKINELIANNKFRNYSKVYLNTNISAATKNALVVVCDNIIQAEIINKKFLFKEHRNFLSFLLGSEYMIYAISKSQWKAIGQIYQNLKANNNLPNSKPITITEAVYTENKESKSETLAFLQKIFSKVEEI